jgi:phenylacetate-CoA ligase
MSESIRKRGFWLVDQLRGYPIRMHYCDIAFLATRPDVLKDTSNARLRGLIRNATAHVPYYRKYSGATSLAEFPVLQKADIRLHYDDFFSERYEREKLVRVTTSGSYGTPLTFGLSPDRSARKTAELIFYSEWAGFHIGTRHANIGSRPKSALKAFMQNEVPMLAGVVDEVWLESRLRRLRSDRITALIGHASVLGLLAKHSLHTCHAASEYSLGSVIATAELLTCDIRAAVREAFGCPVLSRYAAHELGVIAHECPYCGQYHLNTPSLVVELLAPDADRPARSGELARVVVTDLFSQAMPLIRYDTGDLATPPEPVARPCPIRMPVIAEVHGRMAELVYSTTGEPVHPLTILDALGEMVNGHAKQFQFVQESSRGYCIRVVARGAFGMTRPLVDRLRGLLGADADVSVCCVADIPPLASGKRPSIVNNYGRRNQS